MSWIIFDETKPPVAERYLVVVSGAYYEYVDIAYYNGGYFNLKNSSDIVEKYQKLPEIED